MNVSFLKFKLENLTHNEPSTLHTHAMCTQSLVACLLLWALSMGNTILIEHGRKIRLQK